MELTPEEEEERRQLRAELEEDEPEVPVAATPEPARVDPDEGRGLTLDQSTQGGRFMSSVLRGMRGIEHALSPDSGESATAPKFGQSGFSTRVAGNLARGAGRIAYGMADFIPSVAASSMAAMNAPVELPDGRRVDPGALDYVTRAAGAVPAAAHLVVDPLAKLAADYTPLPGRSFIDNAAEQFAQSPTGIIEQGYFPIMGAKHALTSQNAATGATQLRGRGAVEAVNRLGSSAMGAARGAAGLMNTPIAGPGLFGPAAAGVRASFPTFARAGSAAAGLAGRAAESLRARPPVEAPSPWPEDQPGFADQQRETLARVEAVRAAEARAAMEADLEARYAAEEAAQVPEAQRWAQAEAAQRMNAPVEAPAPVEPGVQDWSRWADTSRAAAGAQRSYRMSQELQRQRAALEARYAQEEAAQAPEPAASDWNQALERERFAGPDETLVIDENTPLPEPPVPRAPPRLPPGSGPAIEVPPTELESVSPYRTPQREAAKLRVRQEAVRAAQAAEVERNNQAAESLRAARRRAIEEAQAREDQRALARSRGGEAAPAPIEERVAALEKAVERPSPVRKLERPPPKEQVIEAAPEPDLVIDESTPEPPPVERPLPRSRSSAREAAPASPEDVNIGDMGLEEPAATPRQVVEPPSKLARRLSRQKWAELADLNARSLESNPEFDGQAFRKKMMDAFVEGESTQYAFEKAKAAANPPPSQRRAAPFQQAPPQSGAVDWAAKARELDSRRMAEPRYKVKPGDVPPHGDEAAWKEFDLQMLVLDRARSMEIELSPRGTPAKAPRPKSRSAGLKRRRARP